MTMKEAQRTPFDYEKEFMAVLDCAVHEAMVGCVSTEYIVGLLEAHAAVLRKCHNIPR